MAQEAMSDAPLYLHRATVWFDELDMVGVLHNARYAIHVERAMTAWFHTQTGLDPSDGLHVVKQYEIEFIRPFTRERGELVVEIGLERRGRTSAVFSFRCLSFPEGEDGPEVLHARGTRAIVKVAPGTLRPAAWSEAFRPAGA
jgi:acyl-CoA thioester hydrolase